MISNKCKLISALIVSLPILFCLQNAQASLLSIHQPAKNATVPLGPLTVIGRAIQSNSTLKDCSVQVKTNKAPYDNATPIEKGNYSKWSFVSNQTSPGMNQIEAQLKCTKINGSFLIHHSVRNVTVAVSSPNQTTRSPFLKEMGDQNINQTLKRLANDENNSAQAPSANFTVSQPSGNFSRPIQNDLTNITGAPPIPIHKNATTTFVPKNTTIPAPPINKTTTPQTVPTATKSIISMPHVTGHHETIHIHLSH